MGQSRLLFLFFIFSTIGREDCADAWIQAAELWCRKRPLYQLRHSYCPFSMTIDWQERLQFCQWRGSNHGHLVAKATALPAAPPPLPSNSLPSRCFESIEFKFVVEPIPNPIDSRWPNLSVVRAMKRQMELSYGLRFKYFANSCKGPCQWLLEKEKTGQFPAGFEPTTFDFVACALLLCHNCCLGLVRLGLSITLCDLLTK